VGEYIRQGIEKIKEEYWEKKENGETWFSFKELR